MVKKSNENNHSGQFRTKRPLEVIGKSFPLMDAWEKVSGKARYVDDMEMKVDLYAKILRSPYPHAKIKRIDITDAERLEGVEATLTYKDVPDRLLLRGGGRGKILENHLRFVGDEVAAVAATTVEVAEKALDLTRVEYDVLPAVFDPELAAQEGAPKLYPEGNVLGPVLDSLVEKGINEPGIYEWGDIEKGFDEADVIVEDSFEVNPQIHTPIEPHVCISKWEPEELTVWVSTQTPYEVRDGLSFALGIPEAKVRVISHYIGGGFGSKYLERYIPITALLSKKAGGRSVKIVFTREEEQCHGKRPIQKFYVKIGAKKDGVISLISFKGYYDLGGYGHYHCGSGLFLDESPAISYKAENARFELWDVHTNHITTQACRAIWLPGTSFALEQTIDQVAEKLQMDPIKFRMKNMPVTGEVMPPKPYVTNPMGYPSAPLDVYPSDKVMDAVSKEIDWKNWKGWGRPLSIEGTKRRGIGIAYTLGWAGFYFHGFVTATVVINKDGSVNLLSGTQDLGTGSNTTLRMIVAESLGITLHDVSITTGDTNIGEYDMLGARASRTLCTGGYIVLNAVEEAKKNLRKIASQRLEAPEDIIEIRNKAAFVKEDPERLIPLPQLLTSSVVGSASGPAGGVVPDSTGKVRQPLVQAAEVEVDTETGEIRVIRLINGNYPGRMINPAIVNGQLTGGAIMALGMALYEDFNYSEEDRMYLSDNLVDYRIPRAPDIPEIKNVVIEEVAEREPHVGPPYGAIGVGELSTWCTAAVANAIYNAIGVRISKTPITPERIIEVLRREER